MRARLSSTLIALFAASAASASAEEGPPHPQVQLELTREPGTEDCPGSTRVRAAVAARLGFDPFSEDASEHLHVRFSREAGAYFATVSLRDAAGALRGERRTPGKPSCKATLEDAALAIAIAVDPLVLTRPRAEPTPTPPATARSDAESAPAVPAAAQQQEPEPAVVEAEGPAFSFSGGAGAHAAVGAAPGLAAAGASLRAGVFWSLFSLDVEARGDLPSSVPVGSGPGTVEASLLVASLVPCARLSWFRGCLLAGGGAMRAAAHDLEGARSITSPYGLIGGRAAVDVPLVGPLFARASLDVIAPLARVSLVDSESGDRFWSTPPLSAALGLGLGFEIPPRE